MTATTEVKTWEQLFGAHMEDYCDFDPKCETLTEKEHEVMMDVMFHDLHVYANDFLVNCNAHLFANGAITQEIGIPEIDWEAFEEYIDAWEPNFEKLMKRLDEMAA